MSTDRRKNARAEIISPAGNFQKLKVAIAFGADAVYFSGKNLSLRAQSENFGPEQMEEAIAYAHQKGARAFVLLNIFARNEHLPEIREQADLISKFKPDAFVVSDIGTFEIARETASHIPIHVSTQANITNWRTACFWERMGASRLILARELSLREIAEITKHLDIETEIFVHGAMCMAYSGRCFMSKHFVGRDANLGDCAQPCRWAYHVVEEKRPYDALEIEATRDGTLIFSSRDLCMVDHLRDVISSGVTGLKIEGRMKTAYYVGVTTRAYRHALDFYYSSEGGGEIDLSRVEDLRKTSNRDFTTGFYLGEMQAGFTPAGDAHRRSTHSFAGIVAQTEAGTAKIEVRSRIQKGDVLECIQPGGPDLRFTVEALLNEAGESVERAMPNGVAFLPGLSVQAFSLLRRAD